MAKLAAILIDRKRDDQFRSATPKLLHACAGRPLWQWAYSAVTAAGAKEVCFVGDSKGLEALKNQGPVFATLDEAVKKLGPVAGYFLAFADAALIHPDDLAQLAAEGSDAGEARLPDLDDEGEFEPVFCFVPGAARQVLSGAPGAKLLPASAKAGTSDAEVDALESSFRVLDRRDLADAEGHLRSRIIDAHLLAGVTFTDPASCFVDANVRIGRDTLIEPFTFLTGTTVVGSDCTVGPFARVHDSRLEADCHVEQSVLEGAHVLSKAHVGPWARLRPGAEVGEGAHAGSFVEMKNARLGKGAKAGHLSYLGDAEIGEGANIGAGTITANFDGKLKHKTQIGKRAFIGSGTVLVAPVKIGDGAVTGAGSVVLKGQDVPKGSTVAGVPARPIKKKK